MGQQGNYGKKHPCGDCCFCQWCGDDRCRLCRGCRPSVGRKLSLAEQIAVYEDLNTGITKVIISTEEVSEAP